VPSTAVSAKNVISLSEAASPSDFQCCPIPRVPKKDAVSFAAKWYAKDFVFDGLDFSARGSVLNWNFPHRLFASAEPENGVFE